MGWLRKVGRKINKKLGKVFGSKLGAVIGTVGMFMLMGTITKGLTGWAKSAFGGAADASAQLATTASADAVAASSVGATGTAAEQLAVTASADAVAASSASAGVTGNAAQQLATTLPSAGAEIAASSGQAAIGAKSALVEQALLAGENSSLLAGSGSSVIPQNAAQQATSASSLTQAEQLANATNNMDKANIAISAIDSSAVTGTLNVSPTITDSLIQDALPALEQNAAVVKANVAELTAGNIPAATTSLPFRPVTKGAIPQMSPVDPNAFQKSLANAPAPEPSLFDKGIGKIKDLASSAYEGVTSGEFVGDVAQGVFTGVAMNAIAGSPEEQFISGGVASQPIQEAAQANYIQEVGPSAMAASGLSRMPTFQELSQQTLYGTGSPNYLSQFYQPLATPRMG
jgi:hypothetical protein